MLSEFFFSSDNFVDISARKLSNIIPAQEDVAETIWIVRLGHLLNSKVLSRPELLKRRYFFINLGIHEIVVPSIIRIRKKNEKCSFLLSSASKHDSFRQRSNKTEQGLAKSTNFAKTKPLATLFRQIPSKKVTSARSKSVFGPLTLKIGF